MRLLTLLLLAILMSGCSYIEWQRAPLLVDKHLCQSIEPIVLPTIDEDGYARFDANDREALLEYFIRVEDCLDKIQ